MGQHQFNAHMVPPPTTDFRLPVPIPSFPRRLPPHYSGVRLPPPHQAISSQHHRLSVPRFSAAHFRPSPQEHAGERYHHWQPASIIPQRLQEGGMRLQLRSEMYQMLPPGPGPNYVDPQFVGIHTMQAYMQQPGRLTMHDPSSAQQLPEITCNESVHYPQENLNQWSSVSESTPYGLPVNAPSNETVLSAANSSKIKSSNGIVEDILLNVEKDCQNVSKSHAKESDVSKSNVDNTGRSKHSQDDKSSQMNRDVQQSSDSTAKSRQESFSRTDSHSEETSRKGKSKSPCKWQSKSSSRRKDKSPSRRESNSSLRRKAESPARLRCTSSASRVSRSPARGKSGSSARREDKSPARRNSKSPTRRSNSSARRKDKSPTRRSSKSPSKRKGYSSDKREVKSPARRQSKSPARREESAKLESRSSAKSFNDKTSRYGTPIKRCRSQLDLSDSSGSKRSRLSPSLSNVTRPTADRSNSSSNRFENSQRLTQGRITRDARSRPSSSRIER